MRTKALFAAFILTGCVSSGPTPEQQKAMQDYADCNVIHSKLFAEQQGDPLSLAIAAEASCIDQRVALTMVLGHERAEHIRKTAIQGNASDIAKYRTR